MIGVVIYAISKWQSYIIICIICLFIFVNAVIEVWKSHEQMVIS